MGMIGGRPIGPARVPSYQYRLSLAGLVRSLARAVMKAKNLGAAWGLEVLSTGLPGSNRNPKQLSFRSSPGEKVDMADSQKAWRHTRRDGAGLMDHHVLGSDPNPQSGAHLLSRLAVASQLCPSLITQGPDLNRDSDWSTLVVTLRGWGCPTTTLRSMRAHSGFSPAASVHDVLCPSCQGRSAISPPSETTKERARVVSTPR